jgi:hypothetical protein
MKEQECSKCNVVVSRVIITHKYLSGNTRQLCNPCNTEKSRAYRQSAAGKAAVARAVAKYQAANPERVKAWGVRNHVPIQPCEACGSTKNVDRHHDDPLKPRDISFLCKLHHQARHRELKGVVV